MILMRNLTRRGDYPFNPTTDYFTVGSPTDAGCCTSGQLTTLNSWLSEIVLLHSTVLDAFNEYESDLGIQELFNLWLGITFEDNDVAPASYDLWNANLGRQLPLRSPSYLFKRQDMITDLILNLLEIVRIEAVSNFLAGEGLTDAVTSQPPWLFCNDGYADADEAQWNQPVKDSTGTSVKEGETGYFKLQDVFPKPAANNWAAFWVKLLNAYAFDALNRDGQTLCGQTNRAGFTSKKSTQASIAAAPNTVTTGAYDRYVTICPYGFATTGSHGLPELATAITYTDYPVPNNGKAIDQYTPRSATLYHELFHLTDTAGTTGDPLRTFLFPPLLLVMPKFRNFCTNTAVN
jgi:hypothetical protein